MEVKSIRGGLADLFSRRLVDGKKVGELWELFEVRSKSELLDELSDVSWGIGRIIGGMTGKPYIRMIGDKRHYQKVTNRMDDYGCIRSRRFLIDGKCPKNKKEGKNDQNNIY
jgi:hypothetical protein